MITKFLAIVLGGLAGGAVGSILGIIVGLLTVTLINLLSDHFLFSLGEMASGIILGIIIGLGLGILGFKFAQADSNSNLRSYIFIGALNGILPGAIQGIRIRGLMALLGPSVGAYWVEMYIGPVSGIVAGFAVGVTYALRSFD